ncbi:hypothetical protein CYMTET_24766, partial [Cymbomonas tetramitiformis]
MTFTRPPRFLPSYCLLVALAISQVPKAISTDLCYRIRYGSGYSKEQLLRPATKYPSKHPKSSTGGGVCGVSTYITPSTSYMEVNCDNVFDSCDCQTVTGAFAFYAYNYPNEESSNIGYEESGQLFMSFIQDTAGDVSFVVVADKPQDDGQGGEFKMSLDVSNNAGRGLRLKGADDSDGYIQCHDTDPNWVDSEGDNCAEYESRGWCNPTTTYGMNWGGWSGKADFWGSQDFSDFANQGKHAGSVCCICNGGDPWCQDVEGGCSDNGWNIDREGARNWNYCLSYSHDDILYPYDDCYAWDGFAGKGSFAFKWPSSFTDGMVLGPLPENDFCWTMSIPSYSGLSSLKLGTYDESSNTLSKVTLSMSEVAQHGLQVCAFTCDEYCSVYTNCRDCSYNDQCGWCASSGQCQGTSSQALR